MLKNKRKSLRVWSISLIVVMLISVMPANVYAGEGPSGSWMDGITSVDSTFGGGSGTEGNPYLISTASHLAQFAYNVNAGTDLHYIGKHFKLTDNIDLSNHYWVPIGTESNTFNGYFDGNGKNISNMTIGSSETPITNPGVYGLFGATGVIGAVIKDLGVTNISITAGDAWAFFGGLIAKQYGTIIDNCYTTGTIDAGSKLQMKVGGLVGSNYGGTIRNCYSNMIINTASRAGGLVGENYPNVITNGASNIFNSYATGNVTGGWDVGGLVGRNNTNASYSGQSSNIKNCYATGNVTGVTDTTNVGGVVGYRDGDNFIINCYWNQSANQIINGVSRGDGEKIGVGSGADDSVPLTSAQMTAATGQPDALVDTVNVNKGGSNPSWFAWEQDASTNNGYPTLIVPIIAELPSGSGDSEEDPYLIGTPGNLLWMSENNDSNECFTGKYFKQTADIDMIGIEGFEPIGNLTNQFKGQYDGDGYTISNLTMTNNDDSLWYFGFFGYVGNSGVIKNLTMDADVTANGLNYYYNGILAGRNDGIVEYCSTTSTSTITALKNTVNLGGLVGEVGHSGIVRNCTNEATVIGRMDSIIGGVVGKTYGIVKNYINKGIVQNGTSNGGIVGDNSSNTISNCLNVGTVQGGSYVGAIAAIVRSGANNPSNNFYLDSIEYGIGLNQKAGGTRDTGCSKNTEAELKQQSTYTTFDFDNLWLLTPGEYPAPKPIILAPAISVTVAPGTVNWTTSITLDDALDSGNYLVIKKASVEIAKPNAGDAIGEIAESINYTSADDIDGVDPENVKYVGVYEVNALNNINKFALITLDESHINSEDFTAPTLTAGEAERTGDTTATVKFTSDEEGIYYYKVVESGAGEPTIITTDPNTYDSTDSTEGANVETTISLTGLTSGAKNIYIVVKDNADNVSDTLMIEIPESILVDTDADGNIYTYIDNGNGTATITEFELNGSTNIEIPTTVGGLSVTAIGDSAFEDYGITSVVIPDTVTSIGQWAFVDNGLTSATIQNGVISIGYGAFAYNQLESVTIPDSVKSIGAEAFCCNLLESISIGDSVESIGDYAFACNALTSVTIENSTAAIGDDVFVENQEDDPSALIIYGNTGSTAATYAEIYEYTFEVLDGGGSDAGQPAGSGDSEADPYQIATPENLLWISEQSHLAFPDTQKFAGKYFEMTADIDMSGVDFLPIKSFEGTFNGDNKTIENMTIHLTSDNWSYNIGGLFGKLYGTVKNLELENLAINSEVNATVGGIAGWIYRGTIYNSHITGSSTITSANDVGGIVGGQDGGIIEQSSNAADVASSGSYGIAGGITGLGFFDGSERGTIINSYNIGNITSGDNGNVGGIVGYIWAETGDAIQNCYSVGTVNGGTDSLLGGVAGYLGGDVNFENVYNLDTSAADSIGFDEDDGYDYSSIGFSKTADELKTQAIFIDWDFDNTWTIVDTDTHRSYPYLTAIDGWIINAENEAPGYDLKEQSSTYIVTYDGNNNTGGTVPTDSNSYAQGDTVTVLDNTGNLTKSGYEFTGWNTKADGTGINRTAGAIFIMGDDDVTLSARWTSVAVPSTTVPEQPTNVTAKAGNRQATITFTVPADDGGSPITGYIVTSNPDNITVVRTDAAITEVRTEAAITVDGLTNGRTYTFTVKAVNAVGSSPESAASNTVTPYKPSSGGNSSRDKTQTPSNNVSVTVGGKTEQAATVTSQTQNGRTVTTVTLDTQKVTEAVNSVQSGSTITVPITGQADVTVGELNGQLIKAMENKQAVVEIKTDNATYTLPAQEINIDDVSTQLGQNVDISGIKVSIEIAKTSEEEVRVIEDTTSAGNFSIVVPPVDFSVKCTYGDKTVEISRFNSYVERTVAIPDGADPSKITTAIVVDSDGTLRHVPTKVIVIDGKYYAQINSLTNSTYSVIWHPIEFKDVTKHWAKEAVNDMGSRMIIGGVGNDMFDPDRDITRAEFAAIIVRALGLKPGTGSNLYTDVSDIAWYCDYVKTATEYKIISGYGNNKFGPIDKITREQAMTMIARAMNITGLKVEFETGEVDKLLAGFEDVDKSASYAKNSISACIKTGIISGKNGNLIAPKDNITRAEVAIIVQRLLQKSNLI